MRLRHILFVELLGGIGDLVMALPSIHALASSHPSAEISVFSFRPGIELLKADPSVARVLPATKRDDANGMPVAKEELRELLSRERFDLIVCDANYAGIDQLIEASEAGYKVTRLWRDARADERIERVFLRNLISLGYVRPELADEAPHLVVLETERQWAAHWYSANTDGTCRIVMLNPDSGVAVKRWAPEHFVKLGKGLLDGGTQIVVAAGEDASVAAEIAACIGGNARVLPKMPLRRFASLVALASLFVSSDTGPAKIAAALGVPTVALFGPTWAERYGVPSPNVNLQSPFRCSELRPMNITLQPCWFSGQCVHPGKRTCTDDIDPARVLAEARRLLSQPVQAMAKSPL